MTRHVIGSAVVLISILVFPYWIYIPALFIAIILIPFFWEGILFAFLVETIYGTGIESFLSLLSPLALTALAAIIILPLFRERLRSYV